ncbi:MAG: extracellular solute-binding protein [Streptosporangiaceae bacterium]|nr:extracellular solute-binding protein [Streptosporangiaceae bacterium]MBV9855070.1 extracellular solute-binding protein [Streptosporangiaceae bacterium]
MAVIVVPGAACGSSSGSSPSGSGTLKIITWVNPPALAALKTIDAEFHKKYPAINVQLQTAANVNGPYETLLQQTVDTGSADIVTTADPFQPLPRHQTRSSMTPLQYWSTSGVFAPLNGQNFLSAYTPAAIAAETYKGRVYGVVSGSYQEGVFYNKAIFARYHLGVPATYTQFLGVLRTLKSHSVTPMFLGLGNVGPVYLQFLYYETMIDLWYPHAPGGNLAQDLESGVVKWTSPYFTQAMNEERTLAQYLEPDYTGVPWEAMPGDFAKGSAAMLLDGSWDLATIQQANPSLQAGFFPLPASNVVQDNQPCVGDNLTFEVLRGAANKAAALKWLQFFSTASVYAQYVNITGISPSQSRGSFSSYSARVLGSWFGKGVNLDVFYPLLAGSNGYYDQSAHWPDLQLDVIQGARTPAQAQALYQSAWTAP